ncbi:MAG: radical SAM family heme chaperone HemW [Oscillospiraceae bacterium]
MNGLTGIYIHVPFCLRKCPYCDFYSVKYSEELADRYTEAVCRNIESFKNDGICADTIYFGGGTPSLLTPVQLYRIMDCVQKNVHLYDPETTLEANPCTVDYEKLSAYKSVGINRLSFGFQSADDRQLAFLGRLHDEKTAVDAVENAKKAGFDNISCDLMLGLDGQDIFSLGKTADKLLSLPITHISAYMLKIEPGTAFDCDKVRKKTADEELMCELYLSLCERLAAEEFEHYEVSNFAKEGSRSQHNMKYWTLSPYIGIGPSAHSDYKGKRYECPRDIEDFINSTVQKNVLTDPEPDRLEEYIMLSLRTSDGIEKSRLVGLSDTAFADRVFKKAAELVRNGLAVIDNGRLRLTDRGFLLSNSVIVYLLDC